MGALNITEGNATDIWDAWNYTNIAKLVFVILVCLATLLLNSAVMLAIIRYRSLRTPTNYFLFSLSIADIFTAVLTLPGHLLGEFEVLQGNELACVAVNSPTFVLPCAALLSLVAASVERYIALVHPLRYPTLVSSRKIITVIAAVWLYALLLGVLPIAGVNNIRERAAMNMVLPACNLLRVTPGKYMGFVTLSTYIPGMLVLAYVNFRVFRIAHKQRRLVAAQYSQVQCVVLPEGKRKVVIFVLLVLGHVYVASHLPILMVMAVDYRFYQINVVTEVHVPFQIYVLSTCLLVLCPVAYPLIMAYGNRDVRAAVCRLCTRRNPNSREPTVFEFRLMKSTVQPHATCISEATGSLPI